MDERDYLFIEKRVLDAEKHFLDAKRYLAMMKDNPEAFKDLYLESLENGHKLINEVKEYITQFES